MTKLTPYPHQEAGTKFLIENNGGAIFCDPRTGKTLMELNAIEALGVIPALIIAPSTVLASWYGALVQNEVNEDRICIFDGEHKVTVAKLRNLLICSQYDYFLINYEKVIDSDSFEIRVLQPEIFDIPDWKAIVIDESYRIARFDSNISEYILKFKRVGDQFRSILTGTPICESPLDVVQPYIFLNNEFFGYGVADEYRLANYVEYGYKWKCKSRIHTAKVETFVKENSFQVRLEDLGLGGEILTGMTLLPQSDLIMEWLKWLSHVSVYEHKETGELMDLIPPVKVMFAQKICAGINPLTDEIFDTTKTDWIVDLVSEDRQPSLILSRFTKPIRMIEDGLKLKGVKVGLIDGSVSLPQREELRQQFQDGKLDAVVAQVDTVARGLDFSGLERIIYHSNSFSYEVRAQSILRGQNVKRVTPYEVIDVCVDKTIDSEVVDKLFNKKLDVQQFIAEFKL